MDIKTLDNIAIACDICGMTVGLTCAAIHYENLIAFSGWIAASMWATICFVKDIYSF